MVTGFFEGKVGLNTSNSTILGVVSERPIVVGSKPANAEHARKGVYVAYCGRVPVATMGPVHAGDLLFPSGNNDGLAFVARAGDGGDGLPCVSGSCITGQEGRTRTIRPPNLET